MNYVLQIIILLFCLYVHDSSALPTDENQKNSLIKTAIKLAANASWQDLDTLPRTKPNTADKKTALQQFLESKKSIAASAVAAGGFIWHTIHSQQAAQKAALMLGGPRITGLEPFIAVAAAKSAIGVGQLALYAGGLGLLMYFIHSVRRDWNNWVHKECVKEKALQDVLLKTSALEDQITTLETGVEKASTKTTESFKAITQEQKQINKTISHIQNTIEMLNEAYERLQTIPSLIDNTHTELKDAQGHLSAIKRSIEELKTDNMLLSSGLTLAENKIEEIAPEIRRMVQQNEDTVDLFKRAQETLYLLYRQREGVATPEEITLLQTLQNGRTQAPETIEGASTQTGDQTEEHDESNSYTRRRRRGRGRSRSNSDESAHLATQRNPVQAQETNLFSWLPNLFRRNP